LGLSRLRSRGSRRAASKSTTSSASPGGPDPAVHPAPGRVPRGGAENSRFFCAEPCGGRRRTPSSHATLRTALATRARTPTGTPPGLRRTVTVSLLIARCVRARSQLSGPSRTQLTAWVEENFPAHRSHRKFVEDKANGPAVISALRRQIPGLIAVAPGRQGRPGPRHHPRARGRQHPPPRRRQPRRPQLRQSPHPAMGTRLRRGVRQLPKRNPRRPGRRLLPSPAQARRHHRRRAAPRPRPPNDHGRHQDQALLTPARRPAYELAASWLRARQGRTPGCSTASSKQPAGGHTQTQPGTKRTSRWWRRQAGTRRHVAASTLVRHFGSAGS
jgi:hypothetical protein